MPGRWYMLAVTAPPFRSFRQDLIQSIKFRAGLTARVTESFSMLTANRLRGSIPDFLSGFTSIAFSVFRYDCKTGEVKIKVFLPLDWLLCRADELQLPDAGGYEAQEAHLPRLEVGFSCQGLFDAYQLYKHNIVIYSQDSCVLNMK